MVLQGLKDVSKVRIDYKELNRIRRNDAHLNSKIEGCTNRYRKFISDVDRFVAILVREFNSKKAARAYERSTVSQTGMLDLGRLHEFKTRDDIFLSVRNLKIEKNHGLYMLVDFSGSMCDQLGSVLTQVLILTRFCQKVGIPFRVNGFTTGYNKVDHDNMKPGEVYFGSLSIMELLSSKMRRERL